MTYKEAAVAGQASTNISHLSFDCTNETAPPPPTTHMTPERRQLLAAQLALPHSHLPHN
jgi:hypothetical protein